MVSSPARALTSRFAKIRYVTTHTCYRVDYAFTTNISEALCVKADSQCQKRSDQRPATCCATRARDSCRFTMCKAGRSAVLRNHGNYTEIWREENHLQLLVKGCEFLLVTWVLEPENFPPNLRVSPGKRLWCCWGFQDYRFALSAKDWSYCQNLKQIYLRKSP